MKQEQYRERLLRQIETYKPEQFATFEYLDLIRAAWSYYHGVFNVNYTDEAMVVKLHTDKCAENLETISAITKNNALFKAGLLSLEEIAPEQRYILRVKNIYDQNN